MSINTNYYNYNSSLFSGLSYGTSSTNGIYSLLSGNQSTSAYELLYANAGNSYGTNTASFFTENAKTFIVDAKESSKNLSKALSTLLSKGSDSSFAAKKAESSDTNVLGIKSVDSKKSTNMDDVKVQVNKIATTQKNTGNSLKADDLAVSDTGFKAGENQITLEIEGKSHIVSFSISENETNKSVQQRIAEAINKEDIGIKATVSHDINTGESTLSLESTTTGKSGDEKFTISSATSNVVELTGIDNITQQAQNAEYRVIKSDYTGALQTSKSNDINIGNGVNITLKDAGEATVSIKKDTISQQNDVREMVNYFNHLLEATIDNKSDVRTNKLYDQLTGLTKTYGSALDEIGIYTTSDGYLQINEDKMKTAAESGDLEKFFSQGSSMSNYGFAGRLSKIAGDVSRNAAGYVSKGTNAVSNEFSYSYMNKYNQYMNTGLLFNSLF